MRKLVVLGAGFDAEAGLPTMPRFFQTAWGLLASELIGVPVGLTDSEDLPPFLRLNQVWREWRTLPAVRSPADLEEFATSVEQQQSNVVPDLRYVIGRTFDLAHYNWSLPHQRCGGHPSWDPIYRAFATDVLKSRHNLAVVSFNYSLIFDQALLQVGGRPEYALENVTRVNVDPAPREPVDVIKPHGSINWLVPVDGALNDIVVNCIPGAKDWSGGANWEVRGTYRDANGKARMPLILPPSQKGKATDGLYFRERERLSSVEVRLREIVSKAESCFIVGWSAPVTDKEDIVSTLRDGLQRCRHAYVLNLADSEAALRDRLEPKYRDFLPDNTRMRWDHRGMRPPGEIESWQRFLES